MLLFSFLSIILPSFYANVSVTKNIYMKYSYIKTLNFCCQLRIYTKQSQIVNISTKDKFT